jgi:hypothetical protein
MREFGPSSRPLESKRLVSSTADPTDGTSGKLYFVPKLPESVLACLLVLCDTCCCKPQAEP